MLMKMLLSHKSSTQTLKSDWLTLNVAGPTRLLIQAHVLPGKITLFETFQKLTLQKTGHDQ